MFMNDHIGYKVREDMKLFDEFSESIFFEIEKSQFALDKVS